MRWLKPAAAAVAVGVVAVAAFTAWYVYGAWPVPSGYAFLRHSMWGGGPGALFEGTLADAGGCIRTAGTSPATVVWPPGFRLALKDGEPVIFGGLRELRMGQLTRMGGGWYESGDQPPTSFNVGSCPPPNFLSTGFVD